MLAFYTLAFPDFDARDAMRIEALRRRLDPVGAARVNAHVTIGFGVETVPRDALSALIQRVADAAQPFEVSFHKVELGHDHRNPHGYAFWMPSEGRREIEALHDHLHSDPDLAYPIDRDVPYRPHITLAERPDPEAAQALVDELNRDRLTARGRITHLSLVALRRDQVEPVARFALGGS